MALELSKVSGTAKHLSICSFFDQEATTEGTSPV